MRMRVSVIRTRLKRRQKQKKNKEIFKMLLIFKWYLEERQY